MRIGELELRVRPTSIGTPELELELGWETEIPVDTAALELHGTTTERLERDDVELLRGACEAFLEGRPLPR